MKIVINAFSARLGGGQTYLRNLLAHLPSLPNAEIVVYAPRQLALPESPIVRRASTRWPVQNPFLRALWERFSLPTILRKEQADILFCPGGIVGTRPPRGCQVVTMFRNMTPFDERAMSLVPWGLQRLRLKLLKRVMLHSMSSANLTIFISDFARGVIEAQVRIPKPITIPHGVADSFRRREQMPERPVRIAEGKYLLYVSKFDSYKHHAEVVQAYASLPHTLRESCRLVLVGETDHPCAEAVRSLVKDKGLQDQVMLYGPARHTDLPALYQHAEANLFASSCENCPNILLEALAAGRPVLSSKVMPMPEFGGNGIEYFSPFDPADIARAMNRILSNPLHAQAVAAAAHKESLRFDWAITADRTWKALLDLRIRMRPTTH